MSNTAERTDLLREQLAIPNPVWRRLTKELRQHSVASCAAVVGGLLTVPRFAPYGVRLETLAHLVVAYSRGRRPLSRKRARRWLGRILAESEAARMEDPPEDVFVSNVHTPQGNYRLFPGGWESAHSNLQQLLDSLLLQSDSGYWVAITEPVESLLRLSDAIADRAGVARWEAPASTTLARPFSRLPNLRSLGHRVSFSSADLIALGIKLADLRPFILPDSEWSSLRQDRIVESALTRRPLIQAEGLVIGVLPTAISVAARHYLLAQAADCGRLKEVESTLSAWQEALLFREILPRVETVQRSVPQPDRVPFGDHRVTIAQVPLDVAAVALVGLVHDDLADILENGLNSMMQLPRQFQQGFVDRVEVLAREHDLVLGCIVLGGLGRGASVPVPSLPSHSSLSVIHLADFETFALVDDASFLRLAKLIQHEDWLHSQGVAVMNYSGVLNLMAYWTTEGYSLVPDDCYLPETTGRILIPSDCLRDLRISARVNRDQHSVRAPDTDDQFVTVERLTPHVFFPSQAQRPIYVALEPLDAGYLAGIVERQDLKIWVLTSRHDLPTILRHQLYGIWESLLKWLDRAADFLPTVENQMQIATVRIRFENPEAWLRQLSRGSKAALATPIMDVGSSEITVRLPPGFLRLLDRTANDGERSLLTTVISGLTTTIIGTSEIESDEIARRVVDQVMEERSAREIHLFQSRGPTDHLPNPPGPVPRLIQPEDVSVARLGLAWGCLEQKGKSRTVEGDDAQQLLHCCVDELWHRIHKRLLILDRLSIIKLAMQNLEAIYRERQQWRLTARAMLAINETQENALPIAAGRERKRTIAAVSFRVLIEMAAASGNRGKGRSAGWAELDRLSALISTLLGLASHSDAIRGDLAPQMVSVTEAGRLYFDRQYVDIMLRPYSRHLFDREYLQNASNYEQYRRPATVHSEMLRSNDEFSTAFKEEFDVSLEGLLEVVGALLDLAADEEELVVRFPRATLQRRVCRARGLPRNEVANALRFLTLPSRNRWDSAPKGYSNADWYPWRFRRRLSISLAPLVALGNRSSDNIIFGANQLVVSVSYRLDGLENGYFPAKHFTTSAMQKYVGDTRRRNGHAFTLEVADLLTTLNWHVETNVEMSSLGAPAELGDIDVVAWRRDSPRLYIIECKSLIPRGNTYEVVEELLAFKGKAKDRLGRHVSRVQWLVDNTEALSRYHAGEGERLELSPLFVTNRAVPMRYINALPIPSEEFLTIDELRESMADD